MYSYPIHIDAIFDALGSRHAPVRIFENFAVCVFFLLMSVFRQTNTTQVVMYIIIKPKSHLLPSFKTHKKKSKTDIEMHESFFALSYPASLFTYVTNTYMRCVQRGTLFFYDNSKLFRAMTFIVVADIRMLRLVYCNVCSTYLLSVFPIEKVLKSF
jgi:di/tricarboxylate transporter